jgi:hypothetical protein
MAIKLEELDVGQVVEAAGDDDRWHPAEITLIEEGTGPMTRGVVVRIAYPTGLRTQFRNLFELRKPPAPEDGEKQPPCSWCDDDPADQPCACTPPEGGEEER